MSSTFPADQYASKRDVWLGFTAIVLPTVKNILIGQIECKDIIDIGCGNGIDNNEKMIQKCKEEYGSEKRLSYVCIGIDNFLSEKKFDVATAFFVFQFLSSKELLKRAFQNTFSTLSEGGILAAIVPNGIKNYNPCAEEGKKFGAAAVLPEEDLRDGLPMIINFYNYDEVSGSSTIYFYFRETYEKLLKEVGFKRVEWNDPSIAEKAKEKWGEDFFHSYMNPPKDIVFIAYK